LGRQPYEIEIFKAGQHTASNGATLDFPRHKLSEAANTYNPKIFRAPAIISHDTDGVADRTIADKELCYGVPAQIKLVGNSLKAIFHKMSPKLVQWLRDGALHSISPSFYLPNSPNNPYPGKLALRHIAFLGKTPPSVKGLAPIPEPPIDWSEADFEEYGYCEFNVFAPETGVVDFSIGLNNMFISPITIAADLFQRYREHLIDSEDLETAESVLPADQIQALREQAIAESQKDQQILELKMELVDLSRRCEELEDQLDDDEDDEDEDGLSYTKLKERIAELEENLSNNYSGDNYYKKQCASKDRQIAELNEKLRNQNSNMVASYAETENYKAMMKTLKMSVEDVSGETGIDEDALQAFLDGEGELSKKDLAKLNSVLNTEMSDKEEELEYREQQLENKAYEISSREEEINRRESLLAQREEEAEFSEVSKFVDGLINTGRLSAQRRDRTIKVILNTSNSELVEFSEDEVLTPRQELMSQMEAVKPWNFSEPIVVSEEIPTSHSLKVTPGATAESVQGLEAVQQWCQSNGKDFNNIGDFNEALSALNINF
jgi:hypothetical protein